MSATIQTIILAAGKGTRMKSSLPKVINPLAAKPLLTHVIDTAKKISTSISIVVGFQSNLVSEYCEGFTTFEQKEQLGTGHAVLQAKSEIKDDALILILYGDVPLIKKETLTNLINATKDGLSVLTVCLKNPQGYGRIIRSNGKIISIIEEKDASEFERAINEVNTGILCVNGQLLKKYLSAMSNNNAQKEYYLTDIIAMHAQSGLSVGSYVCKDEYEVQGVNDKWQLANLERHYQKNKAKELCLLGATIIDPNRIDIRGTVEIKQDVTIDVNCIFEGEVKLGNNVIIGANCVIKNTTIDDNTIIYENSSIAGSTIAKGCSIGPFARIRPKTKISDNAKIGNFVETKKSNIGAGSKVSHLSYIGDTEMGANVNIGAGTITCNYDGVNKFLTEIEDDVFVGSATQLVAPVKLKKGATIGAGSTITKEVEEDALVITRVSQKAIKNWQRPIKIKN